MSVLAELTSSVQLAAGVAGVPLYADVGIASNSSAYELDANLDVTSVSDLVRPRTSREQIVAPFKVTVGGTELPYWQRLSDMTVTESLDSGWTFSFSMPRRGDEPSAFLEPLGSPAAYFGVPGGKKSVNIDARLINSSGIQTFRLVTDGVFDNTQATVSAGGDTRQMNGFGAHNRYDRTAVTWSVTPGHGLRRENIVRRILLEAGVPSASIAVGNTGRICYKGIQLVDQPLLDSCNQILKPSLKKLHVNRSGQFVTIPLEPTTGQTVAWTFNAQDVLDGFGDYSESANADGPTCVTVTGSKQITKDDDGHRTEEQVIETYANIPPTKAAFSQTAGSSTLTAVTADPTPDPDYLWLRSRITRRLEYQGDTLLSEWVLTEEWKNLHYARYKYNTTGGIGSYTTCYVNDSGAVADDGSLAYKWVREKFIPTSLVITTNTYDERGFLVQKQTNISRHVIRRQAIKSRGSHSSTWESTNYDTNVYILGNGDGISQAGKGWVAQEVWQGVYEYGLNQLPSGAVAGSEPTYAETETTTFKVNDCGYILSEETVRKSWIERPGYEELYNGGFESQDNQSVFATRETETTYYLAAPGGSSSSVTTTLDYLTNREQVIKGIDGYLPAAERSFDLIDPTWASEFGEDELIYQAAASRFEQQSIKEKVCATALEAVREHYEERLSDNYAEDGDELRNIASWVIRSGCVIEVSFPLPFNPLIHVGQKVHLDLHQIGINHNVWTTEVSHTESESGISTKVGGEVWLL